MISMPAKIKHKKFIITKDTTYNDLDKEFFRYRVTGRYYNSNRRFSMGKEKAIEAFSINLWNGRVWGVRKDGSRQLLKTVIN